MHLARIAGIVAAAWLIVAGARPAAACGVWKMTDVEKGHTVAWWIGAGKVSDGKRSKGTIYVAESSRGLRVVKGKKVVMDVKNGAIRRRGKTIGRIQDDGSITIGKRTYTLAFTNPHDWHGITAWDLAVSRDGEVVIESTEATALCVAVDREHEGDPMDEAEMQAEIRLRVAYYLAWRKG
jgi:hypothetical protein